MKTTLIPLTSLLAASAAFAQTVTYDWNTEAQFNSFNAYDAGAPTSITPTYSSTGGLGAGAGTGSFSFATDSIGNFGTFTTGDAAVAYDLSTSQTLVQSTYFKTGSFTTGSGARPALYLGVTTAASVTSVDNGGVPNVPATGAGLFVNSFDGTGISGSFGFASGGGSYGGNPAPQGSFTLDLDSWYFMEVTFNYSTVGGGQWNPTIVISEATELGVVGDEVATSSITAVFGDDWTGETELRGYIASRGGDRINIAAIDGTTLVAIPEPSAYGLIAGSLALGWIMMRRRK